MSDTCQNCHQTIDQNFCGNCGQKKYKRIDKKYIWDELQYTVLHTNKGFLYSVKKILKNPGKTAREFIDGNRVNHYKPILLAFVLSGLSVFLSNLVLDTDDLFGKFTENSSDAKAAELMNEMMSNMKKYYSFITLALIPIFSLLTYTTFKKWGNNYYEHLVMNAYFQSFVNILSILFIPLYYILIEVSINAYIIFSNIYLYLLIPVLLTLFFKEFYKEKPLKSVIKRILLLILVSVFLFVFLIVIAVAVGFAMGKLKG